VALIPSSPPLSRFAQAIQQGEFLLTAEITPPKGSDTSTLLSLAQQLKGRVHAINITDSNRAMARMSPLAASVLLHQAGVEPILQLACRDRNRLALQGICWGPQPSACAMWWPSPGIPIPHRRLPRCPPRSSIWSRCACCSLSNG
jgi:hypothetical protein